MPRKLPKFLSRHLKKLLRKTLSRVDLITVREPESGQLLQTLDVSGPPIHVTADLAYLLEAAPADTARETLKRAGFMFDDKPKVAVCLCGRHADRPEYRDAVVSFCRRAVTQMGARIWFLPFQTGAGYDDRPGMRSIAEAVDRPGRVYFLEEADDPGVMLAAIKQADLVLGERFHAAIFALIGSVPVVGISYFPKVERLFQEIEHPEWCINLESISAEALIAALDNVWERRDEVTKQLAAAYDSMRRKSERNFDLLAEVLKA